MLYSTIDFNDLRTTLANKGIGHLGIGFVHEDKIIVTLIATGMPENVGAVEAVEAVKRPESIKVEAPIPTVRGAKYIDVPPFLQNMRGANRVTGRNMV